MMEALDLMEINYEMALTCLKEEIAGMFRKEKIKGLQRHKDRPYLTHDYITMTMHEMM